MSQLAPINLHAWIEDHRHLLKPPVGAVVWDGEFLVMVVGGPNRRGDYHINPGGELFFQVEGDIVLKIIEDDRPPRDVPIRQGELFLLPAGVPHSPQRPPNTVGLVVEQPKYAKGPHHLRWYCRSCGTVLHDAEFTPADLGKQLKAMIEAFNGDLGLRTCKKCGQVFEV